MEQQFARGMTLQMNLTSQKLLDTPLWIVLNFSYSFFFLFFYFTFFTFDPRLTVLTMTLIYIIASVFPTQYLPGPT